MSNREIQRTVADLVISCLEAEGVEYMFGIPGEENIRLVVATAGSKIRFILTRHEQAAAFMADVYGRLTGKAGVCTATLGPGAINLALGVADAQTDSSPLVAITAQVGLNRIYKELHQIVDVVSMYKPLTKWADILLTPAAVPEMVRKAFDAAQSERPGAAYLAIPEDIESAKVTPGAKPLPERPTHAAGADPAQVQAAAKLIRSAKRPIILAGHGVARAGAANALTQFSETTGIPVATTYMGKGVISDRHPNALGVVGFMRHDFENFAFDKSDLIIAVGYELQEFAPARINPKLNTPVLHIHRFAQDTDAAYPVASSIEADIGLALGALTEEFTANPCPSYPNDAVIRTLHAQELEAGENDASFPVKPQRIINDIRKALGDEDIVLADTGAIKMWMARTLSRLRAADLPHFQRPLDDGIRLAGRARRQACKAESQGHRRHGRRRVSDEFTGNRDRSPREDSAGRSCLGRWRIRAHQVEDGSRNRSPPQRRFRQSGLRKIRRELRREGLPDQVRRRPAPDVTQGAR